MFIKTLNNNTNITFGLKKIVQIVGRRINIVGMKEKTGPFVNQQDRNKIDEVFCKNIRKKKQK